MAPLILISRNDVEFSFSVSAVQPSELTKNYVTKILAWQQKETYDSKILQSFDDKSNYLTSVLDKKNAKLVCLCFGLSMPKDNMFFATFLILQRWRNYGKQASIWSLCYQVIKEEALRLKLLYPSTASFNFKFKQRRNE